MKVIEKEEKENYLRFTVDSNEESLFSLLKVSLEQDPAVDIVGLYKEHHLIDKTEFFLKVKKGSASELLKKTLKKVKKDLQAKKLK